MDCKQTENSVVRKRCKFVLCVGPVDQFECSFRNISKYYLQHLNKLRGELKWCDAMWEPVHGYAFALSLSRIKCKIFASARYFVNAFSPFSQTVTAMVRMDGFMQFGYTRNGIKPLLSVVVVTHDTPKEKNTRKRLSDYYYSWRVKWMSNKCNPLTLYA